jgi:hypothetical protein
MWLYLRNISIHTVFILRKLSFLIVIFVFWPGYLRAFLIANREFSIPFRSPSYFRGIIFHPSLYVAYLSNRNSSRVPIMNNDILLNVSSLSINFHWHFVDFLNATDHSMHALTGPPSVFDALSNDPRLGRFIDSKARQMIANAIISVTYFLNETNDDWYLRANDDTQLNWPKLSGFIKSLSIKHDPQHEVVFLACCISTPWVHPFPQGGSGWLFSRAAAEALMRVQDGWMRDLQTVDDVSFDATLKRIGLNVLTSQSEAFLGHSPARRFWEDRYAQYGTVPPCQNMSEYVSSKCKQKYGKVNQIVVLHSFVEQGLPYGKLVFNAPDDLWYWNDYPKWTISVCRSTRNPNLLE